MITINITIDDAELRAATSMSQVELDLACEGQTDAVRQAVEDDLADYVLDMVRNHDYDLTLAISEALDRAHAHTLAPVRTPWHPLDEGLVITDTGVQARLLDDLPLTIEDSDDENAVNSYVDDVITYLRDDNHLKELLAQRIWNGSELSGMLAEVIDTTVAELKGDFDREHGYV